MSRDAVLPSSAQTTAACWLSIVGIGEDGADGLTARARALIAEAELVAGGARHLQLAAGLIHGTALAWPSPLQAAFPTLLARRGRPVVVLASGDPFHYGIGQHLTGLVGPGEWQCVPQPGAFSLAAARLGWPLQDTALVSLHGRSLAGVIRHLQPGARLLALSWDGRTPAALAELLAARGLGESPVTVLESLGGPRERIRRQTALAFALDSIDPLNLVAVEVAAGRDSRIVGLAAGRADDLFENDGQLTRRMIRAVTISSLAPRRGELLWDVGLGAGSVAIEWLLTDPSLRAIGIEAREDRALRAGRNAAAFGVPGLDIVTGRVPAALAGLEAPDAIFVGGGLAAPGVLEAVWASLKPGGRLVANAVTLETEAILLDGYARLGGELVRLEMARAEAVGPRQGWRPAMPILHWRVTKP
ncbi:MAG: precorrin-6y C5,15-methyltransferase (decarboxylating) subunit CbiE [Hyphomicrobiaceae bacterium]